jgi:hypothetical protein
MVVCIRDLSGLDLDSKNIVCTGMFSQVPDLPVESFWLFLLP